MQLDEKVALKFLLPEALHNPEAVARFAREARAAVKIKSEHVARVIDVGTLPNGAPYLVMEYLDGGDLAAWLQERGPLPIEQAVEFVLQACEAIAEAHALGIVHRDLKPGNLFCIRRADGLLSIKVLDFGISKMTDTSPSAPGSMTRTSSLMGSPLYMSPEQMRSSKDVDARTDIWALGMILFELMTGRPGFIADSVMEVAVKVATEAPPSIRSFRPEVSTGLEAVVFRCLEKEGIKRYPNVAELAVALLPFAPKRAKASAERISRVIQAAGLSASALAMPSSPQTAATQVSGETVPPVGRTLAGNARSKVAAAVIGVVSVVGISVVATVGVRHWWKSLGSDASNPPTLATQAQAVQAQAVTAQPYSPFQPAVVDPPRGPTTTPATTPSIGDATADAAASAPPTTATVQQPALATRPKRNVGNTAVATPVTVADPPERASKVTPAVTQSPTNIDPLSRLHPK
jgi:serine/threonine-protein kinase